LKKLPKEKAGVCSSIEYKVCVLPSKGIITMKQVEYLTRSSDFVREVRKDSRGKFIEYDELQELGRQGWELVTAQPGGANGFSSGNCNVQHIDDVWVANMNFLIVKTARQKTPR
jgi:hypothetical protein